jgi:hypothetical protein
MKKTDKIEPETAQAEPAQEKYTAILMLDRDREGAPLLGIDVLNKMHVDKWEFMFFRSFGVNETFAYFRKMDK